MSSKVNTRIAALTARFLLCPEECFLARAVSGTPARLARSVDAPAVLRWAARLGHVYVLRRSARRTVDTHLDEIRNTAAEHGQLRFLAEIRRMGFNVGDRTIVTAAQFGHLAVVKWVWALYVRGRSAYASLASSCSGLEMQAAEAAAAKGHVHIIEWILTKDRRHADNIIYVAAANGQIALLDWLALDDSRMDLAQVARGATRGGCIAVLDWLKSKRFLWLDDHCSWAHHFNQFETCRWLKDNGFCRCGGVCH
ncbi:MAG: hypothetical protein KGL39_35430 [Patescibacteria group bacterium]|nr:hypothetical protein [Patescibacteria group bacterium]